MGSSNQQNPFISSSAVPRPHTAVHGGAIAKLPDNVALRDWHLVPNDEYFYAHIFRSWKAAGWTPHFQAPNSVHKK